MCAYMCSSTVSVLVDFKVRSALVGGSRVELSEVRY